jgi:hypothetical protein
MTTYSDAAMAYAARFTNETRAAVAAEAYDAALASVTPYRQPERVLTADEAARLPERSVLVNRLGWLLFAGSVNGNGGPYTLVYDPSWQPAPPVPAPVLLTAEDPRWRDGAKVRAEFADGTAVEGVLRLRTEAWVVLYRNNCSSVWADEFDRVYLLAEAPDPDADRLSAVVEWLGQHGVTTSDSRDLLTLLDSVVKAAEK